MIESMSRRTEKLKVAKLTRYAAGTGSEDVVLPNALIMSVPRGAILKIPAAQPIHSGVLLIRAVITMLYTGMIAIHPGFPAFAISLQLMMMTGIR